MPGFTLSAHCAPVEDVWKLLFDPARFPGLVGGRRDGAHGPAG
jgi:hypothetical protein